MVFKDLRQLFIGDYTFVEVYRDEDERILTQYNGRDNLVDKYDGCRVTGITVCGHYGYSSAIRVELDSWDVDRIDNRQRLIAGLDDDTQNLLYGVLCVNLARLYPDWSWQQVLENAHIGMNGVLSDLEDVINLDELNL